VYEMVNTDRCADCEFKSCTMVDGDECIECERETCTESQGSCIDCQQRSCQTIDDSNNCLSCQSNNCVEQCTECDYWDYICQIKNAIVCTTVCAVEQVASKVCNAAGQACTLYAKIKECLYNKITGG
jgi:hypothetical protein